MRRAVHATAYTAPAPAPSSSSGHKKKRPAPLTVAQESVVRFYNELRLQQLCDQFSFPASVSATSTLFFKRFYLFQPLTGVSANQLFATCIWLASKVEEAHIQLTHLEEVTRVPAAEIVRLEVLLLQGLKFHLRVYHAFRPLQALLELLPSSHAGHERLDHASVALVRRLTLSDCTLLLPPPQIAVAALLHAAEAGDERKAVERALAAHFGAETWARLCGTACPVVERCIAEVEQLHAQLDNAAVRTYNKAIKAYRNPLLDQESEAYKAAEKAAADELLARRQAKYKREAEAEQARSEELLGVGVGADLSFTPLSLPLSLPLPRPQPQTQ